MLPDPFLRGENKLFPSHLAEDEMSAVLLSELLPVDGKVELWKHGAKIIGRGQGAVHSEVRSAAPEVMGRKMGHGQYEIAA